VVVVVVVVLEGLLSAGAGVAAGAVCADIRIDDKPESRTTVARQAAWRRRGAGLRFAFIIGAERCKVCILDKAGRGTGSEQPGSKRSGVFRGALICIT
jgi:hypothetical protein